MDLNHPDEDHSKWTKNEEDTRFKNSVRLGAQFVKYFLHALSEPAARPVPW